MQFFILLFINIILWAAFYLVISLKLERSASEFREKRLRREMDAMIREFNETAERNISLLENRISIAKKLMAQSGALPQLDLSADGDLAPELREGMDPGARAERDNGFGIDGTRTPAPKPLAPRPPLQLGEYLAMLKGYVRDRAASLGARLMNQMTGPGNSHAPLPPHDSTRGASAGPAVEEGNRLIKKEYADVEAMTTGKAGEDDGMDETRIAEMFMNSKDKYSLVADLYEKGCRVELLSRCSGISLGEIRLVLNLSKPAQ